MHFDAHDAAVSPSTATSSHVIVNGSSGPARSRSHSASIAARPATACSYGSIEYVASSVNNVGERFRAGGAPRALVARDPVGDVRAVDHDADSAARDLRPRDVAVDAGLARQAEDALAEDVAHDLRRAALDRVGPRPQEHLAGGSERRVEAGFVGPRNV